MEDPSLSRETDESLKLSDEKARRLLMRAAELDGAADSSLSLVQMRQIATEAGISSRSFDAALEDLTALTSSGDSASSLDEDSFVRRAPAWVRACMFGVPDRAAAMGYYWLFVAGIIAFPAHRLFIGTEPIIATFAGMAFCTFALWSTSRAIRWLDQHGWDSLGK